MRLYQPASANEVVAWIGADEIARDDQGSTAGCWLLQPGPHVVRVTVSDGSAKNLAQDSTSTCVLTVVDIPLDQITVSMTDVWVDAVEIDESLPQDQLNEQTMDHFFGLSIAALRDLGNGRYRTSVGRLVHMTVAVNPPGFTPLMEWRIDGNARQIGASTTTWFTNVGNHVAEVGPILNPEQIEIETYSVNITSHISGEDIISEGVPIVFTAETNPPGYENEITWLSSTKYGSAQPILGEGPIFIAEFNDTWGPWPEDTDVLFQWLGVKADHVTVNQDQKDCPLPHEACCLPDQTCVDLDPNCCSAIGGTPLGPGTSCATIDCSTVGACCLPLDESPPPSCEPSPPDASPDPDCVITTREACGILGGVFLGPKTKCEDLIAIVVYSADGGVTSHSTQAISNCPEENPNDPTNPLCTNLPLCIDGPAKLDRWVTTPDCGTCQGFPGFPPDFFGPGSDPLAPFVVCFNGVPLGVVQVPGFPPLDFGEADTIIRRSDDPFDRCELPSLVEEVVEIEIVALNLVSISPITITFNGGQDPELWNISIVISPAAGPPQPPTSFLKATKEHCNGGTFDSTLFVCPAFIFTKVDPPNTMIPIDFCSFLDPNGIELTVIDVPWSHDRGDNLCLPDLVCTDFHAGIQNTAPEIDCDCNNNLIRDKCDIENGTSDDNNNNGVPDECEP